MGRKRRHHFVPQVLTRNFALDGTMLHLYDLTARAIRHVSTKDTFVSYDMYTYPDTSGQSDSEFVENMLQVFEGQWGSAIRLLSEGREIDAEARGWIACFIAFQYIRTPAMWRTFAFQTKELMRSTVRLAERGGRLPPLPPALLERGETLEHLLQTRQLDVTDSYADKLTGLIALGVAPKFAEMINQMNWAQLVSGGVDYFAISDNPCSIFDPNVTRHPFGSALARREIELVLPFDRHRALLLSWKRTPAVIRANERAVAEGSTTKRGRFRLPRRVLSHPRRWPRGPGTISQMSPAACRQAPASVSAAASGHPLPTTASADAWRSACRPRG